jgi:hypothetical protein
MVGLEGRLKAVIQGACWGISHGGLEGGLEAVIQGACWATVRSRS